MELGAEHLEACTLDPISAISSVPIPSTAGLVIAPGLALQRCQSCSLAADPLLQPVAGNPLLLNQLSLELMGIVLGLLQAQPNGSLAQQQSGGLAPVGSAGGASAGPVNSAGGAGGSNALSGANTQPLTGDEAGTAAFIDKYLREKGSKAADQQFGELAVKFGKQYDVDPMILLAIAGHETQFGKLGVGLNGLLGVGAFDSDPNNSTRNPEFSGVAKQLEVGAKTFANLRKKGGATSQDPVEKQLDAVNKAGWATDPNWHTGVEKMYRQIRQASGQGGVQTGG